MDHTPVIPVITILLIHLLQKALEHRHKLLVRYIGERSVYLSQSSNL